MSHPAAGPGAAVPGAPAPGATGRSRRRVPALLPAATGAAAALLALSTLGLTWVRRSVEGPLGDAGAAQVEELTGRDVAPVVAALVPATAAVVVVALLLRGRWRAVALGSGAIAALGAGVAALGPVLGSPGAGGRTTAVPLLAALACLVAALSALLGVVLTLRGTPGRDGTTGTAGTAGTAVGAATGPAASRRDLVEGPGDPGEDQASLWWAQDEGRDPTDAHDRPTPATDH